MIEWRRLSGWSSDGESNGYTFRVRHWTRGSITFSLTVKDSAEKTVYSKDGFRLQDSARKHAEKWLRKRQIVP